MSLFGSKKNREVNVTGTLKIEDNLSGLPQETPRKTSRPPKPEDEITHWHEREVTVHLVRLADGHPRKPLKFRAARVSVVDGVLKFVSGYTTKTSSWRLYYNIYEVGSGYWDCSSEDRIVTERGFAKKRWESYTIEMRPEDHEGGKA